MEQERQPKTSFEGIADKYSFLYILMYPLNTRIVEKIATGSEVLQSHLARELNLNPSRDLTPLKDYGLTVESKKRNSKGRPYAPYKLNMDKFAYPICEFNKIGINLQIKGMLKNLYDNVIIRHLLKFDKFDVSIPIINKKNGEVVEYNLVLDNLLEAPIKRYTSHKYKSIDKSKKKGIVLQRGAKINENKKYLLYGSGLYIQRLISRPFNIAIYSYLKHCNEKDIPLQNYSLNKSSIKEILTHYDIKNSSRFFKYLEMIKINFSYNSFDEKGIFNKFVYGGIPNMKNKDYDKAFEELRIIGQFLFIAYATKLFDEELPELLIAHFKHIEQTAPKWIEEKNLYMDIVKRQKHSFNEWEINQRVVLIEILKNIEHFNKKQNNEKQKNMLRLLLDKVVDMDLYDESQKEIIRESSRKLKSIKP